jgi:hypothetical protein
MITAVSHSLTLLNLYPVSGHTFCFRDSLVGELLQERERSMSGQADYSMLFFCHLQLFSQVLTLFMHWSHFCSYFVLQGLPCW